MEGTINNQATITAMVYAVNESSDKLAGLNANGEDLTPLRLAVEGWRIVENCWLTNLIELLPQKKKILAVQWQFKTLLQSLYEQQKQLVIDNGITQNVEYLTGCFVAGLIIESQKQNSRISNGNGTQISKEFNQGLVDCLNQELAK